MVRIYSFIAAVAVTTLAALPVLHQAAQIVA